jgi:hypothetical protein
MKCSGGAGSVFSVFRANSVFKPQSVCGAGCTEQARVICSFHLMLWQKISLALQENAGSSTKPIEGPRVSAVYKHIHRASS